MKAYVMMHGQTDFDVQGRIIGKNDPPLNDTGRQQAHDAAPQLKDKEINMILASPQQRTMETAEIIAEELGIDKGKITKGLKLYERAFGELEGKSIEEVDIYALTSWFSNLTPPPDGEPIRETVNRVVPYMNNMVKIFRTKTMLLVVPEHVLRVLFWFFNGLPQPGAEPAIEVGNCFIHEFDTENIPPEIKDFTPILDEPEPESGGAEEDPGRLLTQAEIDALIAELMGGK